MQRNRIGLIGIPLGVVTVIALFVIPLPTALLSVLISANMVAALVVMVMALQVKRPLEFSVFPTLLLVATLFRLALNVAVTRLVLLHAYAGVVIEAFGHFVVGGSLVVGLVVFLILIIIQFVVVTNGAGRVAEVAARFTLDGMPGKQMAIDADLNSGLIGEAEARRRRREVAEEADFYGAMDGASKFVRGDAIAAVIITVVNLFGGLIIGVVQHHLPISEAVSTYSMLSVGDGLVSQIPALLLSVSTGIIVTRAVTEDDFGSDVAAQFRRQHQVIRMAGVGVAALALVPGLPHLAFLAVGALVALVGARMGRRSEGEPVAEPPVLNGEPEAAEALSQQMRVEPLELELAGDLLDLVDPARGGTLLDRIRGLRRKVAGELGIVLPAVRTRDNLALPAAQYLIRLSGVEFGRGTAPAGRMLAVGGDLDAVPGERTREPVFGLPAVWIRAENRHEAVLAGSTVVDRASVITTHLGEVATAQAGRLLSLQQVRTLLDALKATDAAAVDELATAQVGLGQLQRVLAELLAERVPIRDLARIVEAVAERGRTNRTQDGLVEAARAALGPVIVAQYATDGVLPVVTLDGLLEQTLVDSVRPGEDGSVLAAEPALVEQLVTDLAGLLEGAEQQGLRPVLLCAGGLRGALARLLRAPLPRLPVMSVVELGPQVTPERIGVVRRADAAAAV